MSKASVLLQQARSTRGQAGMNEASLSDAVDAIMGEVEQLEDVMTDSMANEFFDVLGMLETDIDPENDNPQLSVKQVQQVLKSIKVSLVTLTKWKANAGKMLAAAGKLVK